MAEIERFTLPTHPPGLPFPSAVRVGGTVYVSGQIGHQPGKLELAPGGLEAEARQALGYMKAAVEAAGSSLDRVVKATVFFADMADFGAFNAIYAEVMGAALPARSGLQVAGLALGARIEIECVAVV